MSLRMLIVTHLFSSLIQLTSGYPSKIIIESVTCLSDETRAASKALQYAADEINARDDAAFRLSFQHRDIDFGSSEAWHVTDAVCQDLKEGGMSLICIESGRAYESLRGLADTLELPLISLNPPQYPMEPINLYLKILSNSGSVVTITASNKGTIRYFVGSTGTGGLIFRNLYNDKNFEVSVRPPNAELLADFIIHKQWTEIIILSDGEHSGLSLPWLWHHLHKKSNTSVSAQLMEMPKDTADYEVFLMNFNAKRGQLVNRIMIDTTSAIRQQKLLASIRAAQFSLASYHYVVTNYDFLPYDVSMFKNGNINISGFQLANKESRGYWNLKKHLKKKEADLINHYDDVDTRAVLAHDAMLVTWSAFAKSLSSNDSLFHGTFRHGRFFNRGYPGIYCDPASDRSHPNRPFASFEHGRTVAKALRGISIGAKEGTLSGLIKFDRNGHRVDFDVSVIDLVSNTKATFNSKEVMVWRQGVGFFPNRTIAQHTRKMVTTRDRNHVNVVTVLVKPFVMLKPICEKPNNKTECSGNNKFEGYCIDLLKLLSEKIEGFNFEVHLENGPGRKQPDGSWDGMIGALLSGRADLAVSSLTISQERERVVDFSKPFMTTGISIMIKKPDKQEFSVFSFMQPLSTEIWMYIIFAYIGVSVVIFLVSRFSPYEWRVEETARGGFTISNDFSVYNCLWFTLAAFMQQGTDILPRSISGRIASSAWWFFTMIIVSSYTANLAAFLTLEKMQAPIESVEDLAKQSKIKYGIQGGGSTASFFKYSSVQIYQRMWRYMESQVPSVFVNSYEEGIERVKNHKGRYAFLLEATANEYQNTRRPCDTMKVGANLNSIGYGVATPFGSDWKDHINLAILALQERGELKKLENKWWYDRGECDQGITVDSGSSASLNLSKVAGIFYILMGGMIASMIAAVAEFLYRSRIEARKANSNSLVGNFAKNLKSALSSQLRLSIQGGAVAQPGTQSHDALKRQQAASFLPASNNEEKRSVSERGSSSSFPYNTAV